MPVVARSCSICSNIKRFPNYKVFQLANCIARHLGHCEGSDHLDVCVCVCVFVCVQASIPRAMLDDRFNPQVSDSHVHFGDRGGGPTRALAS